MDLLGKLLGALAGGDSVLGELLGGLLGSDSGSSGSSDSAT
ncbi:hypothetical protein [Gordonia hydrophobica]|uniref:Uncharacterized protein n=1 Tax=Gordonia hydrophobica TaxID=40516 RepID=A0ABZ2TWE9_9ACTN|nr:hypothetical protein [Gordonia hydrophobica]MBM7365787.1 hypothetical protein [Gordonia hydrophobica]